MRISALFGVLLLTLGCRDKTASPTSAPVPVVAAEVIVRDQPVYFEAMGQAIGSQDVEIRARAEGILEAVHFHEGALVAAGDLLYTIDPSTLEANLAQAKGNLAQAEAALDKAKRDVARLTPLWEKNAVSRQMVDDAQAAERSAAGAVETAQAAGKNVDIQLGYTKIYAPISGLIGKTEVKPGNLVGRGQSTLLSTVSALDPIHLRFSISEQDYLAVRRARDAQGGDQPSEPVIELVLADGSIHPEKGTVAFADRNVDPATGTLLVEAAFPNPGGVVRPGQFGRVRVPIRRIPGAILVPQRAVQEMQATYSVFVVAADGTAEFRPVTVGPRIDSLYVIDAGLQPGEKVVVEGAQKLQNNMSVAATFRPAEGETPAAE